MTGKNERRDNGHDERHKKSKIKRRITIRKRMKSTIKIKSRTP